MALSTTRIAIGCALAFSLCAAAQANGAAPVLIKSFRTESLGTESGAPIWDKRALYVMAAFPHRVMALDLQANDPGRIKWQVDLAADHVALGLGSCGRAEHGPVLYHDRIMLTTADGHLMALSASSGATLWDIAVADLCKGETLAAPPTADDRHAQHRLSPPQCVFLLDLPGWRSDVVNRLRAGHGAGRISTVRSRVEP